MYELVLVIVINAEGRELMKESTSYKKKKKKRRRDGKTVCLFSERAREVVNVNSSILNDIDPSPVNAIDFIKSRL